MSPGFDEKGPTQKELLEGVMYSALEIATITADKTVGLDASLYSFFQLIKPAHVENTEVNVIEERLLLNAMIGFPGNFTVNVVENFEKEESYTIEFLTMEGLLVYVFQYSSVTSREFPERIAERIVVQSFFDPLGHPEEQLQIDYLPSYVNQSHGDMLLGIIDIQDGYYGLISFEKFCQTGDILDIGPEEYVELMCEFYPEQVLPTLLYYYEKYKYQRQLIREQSLFWLHDAVRAHRNSLGYDDLVFQAIRLARVYLDSNNEVAIKAFLSSVIAFKSDFHVDVKVKELMWGEGDTSSNIWDKLIRDIESMIDDPVLRKRMPRSVCYN